MRRRTINEDPPLLVGLPPALVLVVGVVLKQIIVRKQLVSSLSSLFPGRREEVVGIYDTHEDRVALTNNHCSSPPLCNYKQIAPRTFREGKETHSRGSVPAPQILYTRLSKGLTDIYTLCDLIPFHRVLYTPSVRLVRRSRERIKESYNGNFNISYKLLQKSPLLLPVIKLRHRGGPEKQKDN